MSGLTVACCVALLATASSAIAGRQTPGPPAQTLTLTRLVDPKTRVEVNGGLVQLALHGLIRFDSLADLFPYIDDQSGRWTFATAQERQAFGDDLLQRGVESRIVSMQTELPLEIVLTHTRSEVGTAVDGLYTGGALVFKGRHWQASVKTYREAFLRVRDRWSTSLNFIGPVVRAIRSWTRRVHVSSIKSITFLSLRTTWLHPRAAGARGPAAASATGTACFQ